MSDRRLVGRLVGRHFLPDSHQWRGHGEKDDLVVKKTLYSFEKIKLLPSGTGTSFLSSSLDSIIRVVRAFLRSVDNQLDESKLRVDKKRMKIDTPNKQPSVASKTGICTPCSTSVLFLPTTPFPSWVPVGSVELLFVIVPVELVAVLLSEYSPAMSLPNNVYGHICAKTPPSDIISLPISTTGIRIVEKKRTLLIVIPVAGDLLLIQVGSLLRQLLFRLFQQPGV